MKKLVLVTLLFMLILSPVFAAEPIEPNVSKLCKQLAEDDPVTFAMFFDSHGDCVSILQAATNNGNTDPVALCKLTNNAGFKNQGQCVSSMR